LKVGIIIDNLIANGAQMVAWNLAKGLSRDHQEVFFYYYHEYPGVNTIKSFLHEQNITCRWIYGPRFNLRRYMLPLDVVRTWKALSRDAIDVVNVHTWEKALILRIVKRLPEEFPVVYTHHGTKICNSDTKLNRIHLGVYHRYRYDYENLAATRNCSTIDVGLDIDALATARISKNEARTILGVPSHAKIVLTVGRANRHRGCDLWIDIVKNLERKNREDFYFVFIGADRGEYLENLRHMAKNNPKIIVKGTLSHEKVLIWMCASDVLLMTSRTESFAIKAVEALYCGCAVVSHYLGVLSDLIQDGVNGTIVDYMDIDGMEKAVEYWLDGHQPPPFILPERYTLSAMVSAYENCFVNLLAQTKGCRGHHA